MIEMENLEDYRFYETGKIIKKKKQNDQFSLDDVWKWAMQYLGYTDFQLFEKEVFNKMYEKNYIKTSNGVADYDKKRKLILLFGVIEASWENFFYETLKKFGVTIREKWISVDEHCFKMKDVYYIKTEEDRIIFNTPGTIVITKRISDIPEGTLIKLRNFLTEKINEQDVIITHQV